MPHIIVINRGETEQYIAAKDIQGIELRSKKINLNGGIAFKVVFILGAGETTMIEIWSKDEESYNESVIKVRRKIEEIMRGKVLPPPAEDTKLTTKMLTMVFDETLR